MPFLERVNAILLPSGCQVGEEAIPSNLGNLIGIVFKNGVITKTSDLLFLKETYASFFWSLDQAGDRIGFEDLTTVWGL